MTTDFRAELQALLNEIHELRIEGGLPKTGSFCLALNRARAALAEPIAGPAGGNYREVWDMSSKDGSLCFASAILSRLVGVDVLDEVDLQWLAAYLQANSTPQPVLVSERLPRPEEMTEDSKVWIEDPGGDCEWEPHRWGLSRIGKFDAYNGLRWLPAHALPIPTAND